MSNFSTSTSRRKRALHIEALELRELLTVDMTAEEQLFIELVNRARADPLAEVQRNPDVDDLNEEVDEDDEISPDPKQPLAPHQSLTDAMGGHAIDMLRRDFFGHVNPDGESPSERARAAGYPAGAGENIAWFGNTGGVNRIEEIYLRHRGLVDSVGHRINLMNESWKEVGAAVFYGNFTQENTEFQSIMVGTLFGNRGGNSFITGVAISDHIVPNNFYEIGEGLGDVTITAVREGTSETYTDVTGASGGYGIRVPNGTYTVTASGGNLSREITVRAVEVDGLNVKIDFNNFRMPTYYIEGTFFDDANSNGRQDANERPLANRTVWLDLNDDGEFDANEPRMVSDSSGRYRIDGLMPGDYTVRQVLPNRWEQTFPAAGSTFVIPLVDLNITGVNFGASSGNLAPVANADEASAVAGQAVSISVTHNDSDPEGNLAATTIQIATAPRNGTVFINESQQIVYTADSTFSGVDSFTYTVGDTEGLRSNSARVTIDVASANPWQNPNEPLDVNGDGGVFPLDALLVIRELNQKGPGPLAEQQADQYFFDVSGDAFLSAIDALRIIIHLNNQPRPGGEPPEPTEPIPQARSIDAAFAMAVAVHDEDRHDQDLEDEDLYDEDLDLLWPLT